MLVYHAWDPANTARQLCIDPVTWTEAGPVVDGPTWETTDLQRVGAGSAAVANPPA